MITEREKIFLLEIARESIRSWLGSTGFRYEPSLQNIISLNRPIVLENVGGFVTIYKDNKVRTCVGKVNPKYPLYLVVRDSALETTRDFTFNDFNDIICEISVLKPFTKVESVDDIELGVHGIHMINKDNGKSGLFLPQVSLQNGWNKVELLEHCSTDKMYMNPDDWRLCDLYKFEAISFNEKQYGLI